MKYEDHTTLNTSACLVWNSLSNNYKDDTMTATFKLSCKFFVEKSAATDCSQCTFVSCALPLRLCYYYTVSYINVHIRRRWSLLLPSSKAYTITKYYCHIGCALWSYDVYYVCTYIYCRKNLDTIFLVIMLCRFNQKN